MQISTQNNLAFSSVHLKTKNIPLSKPLDMIESCFELKGFYNQKPEIVRKQLTGSQAGVVLDKNGITLVGQDREADEFIARQMTKGNIEHTYVQDTPETNFDGPTFELFG